MGNGIAPIGVQLSIKNNIAFRSGQSKTVRKGMSAIDLYYAQELKAIREQKRDSVVLSQLDESAPIQKAKNRIQIVLDSFCLKGKQ